MTTNLLKASVLALSVAVAGSAASAQEILVNSDISTSTTWTSSNTYNLQKQVYVLPGATLTIEAGTVIASTTGLGGSLAVCKGAQIFVKGNEDAPVIMTSKADVATWTGGNPKTGTWRESANEWGNLTIMGDAYISEDATVGNTPVPSASNYALMEGLVPTGPTDTKTRYGGGDDNDDSGSIEYLSIRYGGKVIALTNELNGLSLGGIGRETDINHVEIMNNVDDGIEIWGGTVNLKNFAIWNVGDDSFDVDQGWRGKAQFGLIVEGYSLDAGQGSGVGDNAFETDGAENADWQPVTTATIYNCTVIGQPFDGDGLTAWRDNARVQYRNCVFMDGGEKVVRADNLDGDGALGYGHGGTLSWAQTWTTPYTATSTVNAPANPAAFYQTQTSGNLAEIKDSVFYNNTHSDAYTEAVARGVFAPTNNNVREPALSPITQITRGTPVVKGGKAMARVTYLDPRPINSGVTNVDWAQGDDFFSAANYRGAFAPNSNNWLAGWTASAAFGLTPADNYRDIGFDTEGAFGYPVVYCTGNLVAGTQQTWNVTNAKPNSIVYVAVDFGRADFDLSTLPINLCGITPMNPFTAQLSVPGVTSPTGSLTFNSFNMPNGIASGLSVYMHAGIIDPFGSACGIATLSNAIHAIVP